MPFCYRTCQICGFNRICCRVFSFKATERLFKESPLGHPPNSPIWLCELCDEENDVTDWPASPSEATDDN